MRFKRKQLVLGLTAFIMERSQVYMKEKRTNRIRDSNRK